MQLAEKEKCTGCTACASICPAGCISMGTDTFGFLYPQINDLSKCTDCGLCSSVCPDLNQKHQGDRETCVCYAAMAKDDTVREQSSSGGVFSLLAKAVLAEGGAVYGAAFDKDFCVHHRCAEDENELAGLRGAKYAESDPGNSFREIKEKLSQGQRVLFAGTPCQVAGLRAFTNDENLVCVDFICHSVPSPKVWQRYVAYRACKDAFGEKQIGIDLRSKETGWSRYGYSAKYEYPDGKVVLESPQESKYMQLFIGGHISRRSCYGCSFKGDRHVSDITLGDFWGVWNTHPEVDDDRGTSAVILHTKKGRKLWKTIGGDLRYSEVSLEDITRENKALISSVKEGKNRERILKGICERGFEELNKPVLSVIIPVHNAARTIRRTVRSVMAQDMRDRELILVENGSTDNTYDVLLKLKADYAGERITIVRSKAVGTLQARKRGIEIAQGKYVTFIDADDTYYNNKSLGYMVRTVIQSEADVCQFGFYSDHFGWKRLYQENTKETEFDRNQLLQKEVAGVLGYSNRLLSTSVWNKVFRNGLLKSIVKQLDLSLIYTEDMFLAANALLSPETERVFVSSECYYVYHRGLGVSSSEEYEDRLFREYSQVKPRLADMAKKRGVAEDVLAVIHRETIYFFRVIIGGMIIDRCPKEDILARIQEYDAMTFVQDAKEWLRRHDLTNHDAERQFLTGAYTPEKYYEHIRETYHPGASWIIKRWARRWLYALTAQRH